MANCKISRDAGGWYRADEGVQTGGRISGMEVYVKKENHKEVHETGDRNVQGTVYEYTFFK